MDLKNRITGFGPGALSCVVICVLIFGLTTAAHSDDCLIIRHAALFDNCSINYPDHAVTLLAGTGDVVAEKQPDTSFPGVTAKLTKTITYTFKQNETDDRGRTKRKTWNYTKSMTVLVQFDVNSRDVEQGFDPATMQMKPKRYKYKPQSYRVSSSSYQASGRGYEAWQNGPILEYEITDSSTESGTCSNLKQDQPDFPLIIDFDVSSGKIIDVSIPSFTADLNITGQHKCTKKTAGSDPGDIKTTDCSYPLDRTEEMSTQAIGDDECWEITGGDGKSSVSGSCQTTNNQRLSTQQSEFSWEVSIRE